MHEQTQQAIDSIKRTPRGVGFSLTSNEQSPMGHLLYCLYYRTNLLDLVPRESVYGFPHSGGQHKFSYSGSKSDALVLLEMMVEHMGPMLRGEVKQRTEVQQVLNELAYVAQELIKVK